MMFFAFAAIIAILVLVLVLRVLIVAGNNGCVFESIVIE